MEQETWEVFVVLAMLVALTVVGAVQWVKHRALSWGAFGVCLMVPEAVSAAPDEALLYGLMATTATLMGLQTAWDWWWRRRHRRVVQAQVESTDASPPEGAQDMVRPRPVRWNLVRGWRIATPWRRG
ncbi:MAG TPA: hypothetical protein VNO84_06690 [Burkholderiaceae bacterium]|nr:hypothetical protein [Burkholderiaceae bacterium]